MPESRQGKGLRMSGLCFSKKLFDIKQGAGDRLFIGKISHGKGLTDSNKFVRTPNSNKFVRSVILRTGSRIWNRPGIAKYKIRGKTPFCGYKSRRWQGSIKL
jgi:hypothetical protein